MSVKFPTSDSDVTTIVRAETGYEDNPDELTSADLDTLIERAKGRLELKTGSSSWYSDDGLGYALGAYSCIRAKAAVENIPLDSYNLGDESVSFESADPEDSQQLQQWAEDVRIGLNASDADDGSTSLKLRNSTSYIGETSVDSPDYRDDYGLRTV